jgi:hypothetical protein
MKDCVVFCTIRSTESFKAYAENFRKYGHNPHVVVVDETGETRELIHKSLEGFNVEFYGAEERKRFFELRGFDSETVPAKTTDVIGFSLLVVYPRNYDMVVFVDDDTYPIQHYDFLGRHWKNLDEHSMKVMDSLHGWVNPHPRMFGRGHPYVLRNGHIDMTTDKMCEGSVLNMGLWRDVPDLNAIDYLFCGSLQGIYHDKGVFDSKSYILGDNYMPLCRMNMAFRPEIIPAFYQGTGDVHGVGRYGDVFSGLFLMKIARFLGDNISFGHPLCVHKKEPRDVFKDVKNECEAIKLNETMWKVLDQIEIEGKDYGSCYLSLAKGLLKHKREFHNPEYIEYLVGRMRNWVKVVEV